MLNLLIWLNFFNSGILIVTRNFSSSLAGNYGITVLKLHIVNRVIAKHQLNVRLVKVATSFSRLSTSNF